MARRFRGAAPLALAATLALVTACSPTTGGEPAASAPTQPLVTPRDEAPAVTPPNSSREPTSRRARGRVRYGFSAVDGDTLRRGALDVRVVGIDTPEYGECGFEQARAATDRFIGRGIRLANRSGRDQYGRLLAYVVSGESRDLGTMLIRKGLANARYDGTDGYQWHPHQNRYRRLDRTTAHLCGRYADSLGGPEPYLADGRPSPNCDAAQSSGAAPLRRGDAGWNPDLDGDGDGVACE